ncbi:MAG: epimerase [Fimbriimonadaceae bacterium]|nr:epimerase [Fimbriimonadaceae bacterium]
MKVLVLGGTRFVGRAMVEALLGAGHEVALFHRGQSGPGLFPECEHILGDRRESLGKLADRSWDAVFDVCAYIPREARMAGEALAAGSSWCLLVSTISVYDNTGGPGPNESAAVLSLDDPATETVDAETYGGLKALVEAEAHEAWGDRLAVVRPGIVAGPNDPTDRFTYWATRSGPTRVPPRLEQPVQAIDARDLARLCLLLAEGRISGTFNACGEQTTLGGMLASCGVEPVEDAAAWELGLPLVLPADGSSDFLFRCPSDRARAHGLANRPLAETAADTRAWWESQGRPPLKTEPA